ncbi:MAG: TolC family protein [Dokdonella sp.]|nr:TolC family protein [Dokdonella sp.]
MVIVAPFSRTMAADNALTINEAVRLAAERAPMLLARQSSRVAASEDLVRSDALPDPTLTLGVQNLPIGGQDAFTVSRDRMTMRRIGLSQALPSRSKRDARREFAHARLEQADAEALATALDIKRATARAWVHRWAAEKERDLLGELREQAGLSVQATQARLRGGSGSASDALAARSAELELQNRIDEADVRIEQAHAGLERWLGELPERALAPPPDFSRAPFQEAELLADLDRQGPLLSWDAREAAAAAAVALARAEKRPDWSVSAGVARRGAGASNVIWLEVGVGLPLFSGNRQDRGVSARTADLDAIRATREDARRMQAESIRKDFALWEGLIRQEVRLRDTLLPLSRDRSRTALAAYAGGASLQDWLDARRDEIDTRIDYAEVLARWGQAWVELAYLLPDTDVDSAHSPITQESTR